MTLTELEEQISVLRQAVEDKAKEQEPAYEIMKAEFDKVFEHSKEQIEKLCSDFGITVDVSWQPHISMRVELNIRKSFPEK